MTIDSDYKDRIVARAKEGLKKKRTTESAASNANLRDTHPNLYRSLMTVALIFIALGFNFLLTTPTFQQYDIPKNWIGASFLVLGLGKLLFLNLRRSIKAVRVLVAVSIVFVMFWGVGTTQTFFEGKSSLQLFILYWGMAALMIPMLLEPFFNPVTANGVEE